MEQSFDLGRLIRNNRKSHKIKPMEFTSVANGIKKRLNDNIKNRKSSRLTTFDNVRQLSVCVSPLPVSTHPTKVEHRRQQLEKWKQQKEKERKEAAALKKKPFIAGVAHVPIKFVPPPPVPKIKPSTSGRVTRSQMSKSVPQPNITKSSSVAHKTTKSFAPKNASFRPPDMKNTILPKLGATDSKKNKKQSFIFNPILPHAQIQKELNKTAKPGASDTKNVRKQAEQIRSKEKNISKPSMINNKPVKLTFQSSSSEKDDPTVKILHTKAARRQPERTKKARKDTKPSPIKNKTIPAFIESSSTEVSSSSEINLIPNTRPVRKQTERTKKARKSLKQSPLKSKLSQSVLQSSSSDMDDQTAIITSIRTRNGSRLSLAPSNLSVVVIPLADSEICTPNKPVPKSESGSEERLRSPKAAESVTLTPEQLIEEATDSPFVTISRGKENARKEHRKKLVEGLLDEDTSDIKVVDKFRQQLKSEIERMTAICDTWEKISLQEVLPESVQEAVLSAVGLARLLMSQKLMQFADLIEACAVPQPGRLVTPADLQGFWDMVFLQVENVDVRFKRLEDLRSRGWVEAEPVKKTKKVVKVPHVKANIPSRAPSQLRNMIAAARKAKKEHQETSLTVSGKQSGDNKTFEAGFFTVMSPVKSPVLGTPTRSTPGTKNTLLKSVLSSEAKRSASKSAASFAMLRASVLAKNIEYEGIAPIPQTPKTPVNLNATPGRSILKNTTTGKKSIASTRKSIKVVLFDQPNVDSPESSYCTPNSGSTNCNVTNKDNATMSMNNTQNSEMHDALHWSPMETRRRRKTNQNLHIEATNLVKNVNIEESSDNAMDNKENSGRQQLVRQDAVDENHVTTRSSRKTKGVETVTPRRSTRKKVLQEAEENVEEGPQRASRRKSTRI